MTDWGYLAHQAAEKHLDACQEATWCSENGGLCDTEHEPGAHPSPAIGPYCDCQTCIVREVLHAAWPVIEAAVRSGDFDVQST